MVGCVCYCCCYVKTLRNFGTDKSSYLLLTLSLSLVHTHTNTHTYCGRAGTLSEGKQNHPFSAEQKHRGEDAWGAYWYSLQPILMIQTLSHSHSETGTKPEKEWQQKHLWVRMGKLTPTSPPLSFIYIPQLPTWPDFDFFFFKRQNNIYIPKTLCWAQGGGKNN